MSARNSERQALSYGTFRPTTTLFFETSEQMFGCEGPDMAFAVSDVFNVWGVWRIVGVRDSQS